VERADTGLCGQAIVTVLACI